MASADDAAAASAYVISLVRSARHRFCDSFHHIAILIFEFYVTILGGIGTLIFVQLKRETKECGGAHIELVPTAIS